MELDNVDVLLGMIIGSIILGMGLSIFVINPHNEDGAVVLAIGMMTMALMITARPRVIERVKREFVLQPSTALVSHPQTEEATPPQEGESEENQAVESNQSQPEENAPQKQEELIATTPS